MTVATTEVRKSYTGDGATTVFAFPYSFDLSSDLKIYLDAALQGSGYTVTGGDGSSGSVTFASAPGSGVAVLLLNDPPQTQARAFVNLDSIPKAAFERAYDKLTRLVQRLGDRVDRSVQLSDTAADPSSPITIPSLVGLAGKTLKVNSGETGLEDGPTAADIENASTYATNAADSATAAASSASAASTSEGNAAASAAAALGALSGAGFRYAYSTTTTDADPGAGTLRLNAAPASATALYIDNADADGSDISGYIDAWDDYGQTARRGILTINGVDQNAAFATYLVTGSVIDGTGYRKATLSLIDSGGTWTDADEFVIAFTPAGADGEDGASMTEVAADPDADDDDSNTGGNGTFQSGSMWRNTATGVIFTCGDPSTGAAVWWAINVSGGLIGEVVAWPAAAIPSGWLECDGAAVSRTTYASLFAAISTTFGVGDGSTTFNLPDLRGEFIRGLDNGRGVDSGRSLNDPQTGQVGDHKHETQLGRSGTNDIVYDDGTEGPFGSGGVLASGGTYAGVGNYGSPTAYDLTNTPYRSEDDEATNETRPRNVALKYIIRAASTYDVADLTPNMPAASEVAAGAIEIATQAEVDDGAETAKAVVPATLKSTYLPQVAPDAIFEDQKAATVHGGSPTVSVWTARTLNTEVRNIHAWALSSNQITLPSGTYYVEAELPYYNSYGNGGRLYNVTDAAVMSVSQGGYSVNYATCYLKIAHVFTLAAEKTVELQQKVSSVTGTWAFGHASSSGLTEVYTRLKIWRLA